MKLHFCLEGKSQPDPFIFYDEGKYYLYVTADAGVEAYSADDVFGAWEYEGIVTHLNEEGKHFWAPSIIKYDGRYYMYVSFERKDELQFLYALSSNSPLGPFGNEKKFYSYFSIDSHVVETEAGLFLFFAKNKREGERIGTRVFVDRLIDPYTPVGNPIEKIVPTFDEEIYTPSYTPLFPWHTIEGPFWFCHDGWQYLMYSGGCYQDDTYHIGCAVANTTEPDLTKVDFIKVTDGGHFRPILIKNEVEEGTGHHSVIKLGNRFFAIYHARDIGTTMQGDARTARVCELLVQDGTITAKRM